MRASHDVVMSIPTPAPSCSTRPHSCASLHREPRAFAVPTKVAPTGRPRHCPRGTHLDLLHAHEHNGSQVCIYNFPTAAPGMPTTATSIIHFQQSPHTHAFTTTNTHTLSPHFATARSTRVCPVPKTEVPRATRAPTEAAPGVTWQRQRRCLRRVIGRETEQWCRKA